MKNQMSSWLSKKETGAKEGGEEESTPAKEEPSQPEQADCTESAGEGQAVEGDKEGFGIISCFSWAKPSVTYFLRTYD